MWCRCTNPVHASDAWRLAKHPLSIVAIEFHPSARCQWWSAVKNAFGRTGWSQHLRCCVRRQHHLLWKQSKQNLCSWFHCEYKFLQFFQSNSNLFIHFRRVPWNSLVHVALEQFAWNSSKTIWLQLATMVTFTYSILRTTTIPWTFVGRRTCSSRWIYGMTK